jgi:sugar phosphate permease
VVLSSHRVSQIVLVFMSIRYLAYSCSNVIGIAAVNPDGDLVTLNGYLLVNNLCGLVGYYCAAKVIDMPSIGRVKLQCFSFMLCGVIFLTAGAIFNKTSPQVLMFLYFFSSFVVNFGPNVTTYVMAAETYPTELRGTCHGSKSL